MTHPRPMLTALELDAVSRAVSQTRLRPYVPPMRAFSLGDASTFGIRRDYGERTTALADVSERTRTLESRATSLAAQVANVCVSALHTARVDISTSVTPSTPLDDAVLLCADELTRVTQPALLLRVIHASLDRASMVVIATTLRVLTVHSDHDDLGPPSDISLVREWTFPELQWCLQLFGIEPLFGGVVEFAEDGSAGSTQAVGVIVASRRTPTARALHHESERALREM